MVELSLSVEHGLEVLPVDFGRLLVDFLVFFERDDFLEDLPVAFDQPEELVFI